MTDLVDLTVTSHWLLIYLSTSGVISIVADKLLSFVQLFFQTTNLFLYLCNDKETFLPPMSDR